MTPKMIYTVLVQLIGYVALLYRHADFPKRLRFIKDTDGAWIHIHNNAARYILACVSRTYILGPWRDGLSAHISNADITIVGKTQDCVIILRRYSKPGVKRPYYALAGRRTLLIGFLSNLVNEISKK